MFKGLTDKVFVGRLFIDCVGVKCLSMKKLILPKSYVPEDLSKPAFVYFSVYNDLTGRMVRFRKYHGFAKCKTNTERKTHASKLCKYYKDKLLNGWNPFFNNEVVYTDNVDYQRSNISKKGRKKYSVAYYMNAFLEARKHYLAKSTYQNYQTKFRRFENYLAKRKYNEIDVSGITEKIVKDFFDNLVNEEKHGKTLNLYIIVLNALWKYIQKQRKFLHNPFLDITKFPENSIPQRPIKKGIITELKNELQTNYPNVWLAAQFEYYCFARPKEIRFMQIKHLDLYDGYLTLYGDITKSGKSRTVQIPDNFLRRLLIDYKLREYPDSYYIITKQNEPGPYPVGKNYLSRKFNEVRKKLNLPMEVKLYNFQHTAAVNAIKSGANIKEIQHQKGHSSLSITEQYLKGMIGEESDFFRNGMPDI